MWAVGSVLPESRQTGLKLGKEAGKSHRKRRQEGTTGKDRWSCWSQWLVLPRPHIQAGGPGGSQGDEWSHQDHATQMCPPLS